MEVYAQKKMGSVSAAVHLSIIAFIEYIQDATNSVRSIEFNEYSI
jgi:hypothetical protein